MATNYLNNLNYPIIVNSSVITNSDNKDLLFLNSKRTQNDLVKISNYINMVLVPGFKSLTSKPRYPYDAVESGINGLTLVTYPEEEGNDKFNTELYWKKENELEVGRPCTVKESFDYLQASLIDRIIEIRESTVDVSSLWEQIRCNAANLERVQKDSLGINHLLECSTESTRNWSLSKHLYEILTQVVEGHNLNLINELDDGSEYPSLRISSSIIEASLANTSVSIHNDVFLVDPVEGQTLVWNGNAFVNNNIDYNNINNVPEIPDAVTSINQLEGNIDFQNSEGKILIVENGEIVANEYVSGSNKFYTRESNSDIEGLGNVLNPQNYFDPVRELAYRKYSDSWEITGNKSKSDGLSLVMAKFLSSSPVTFQKFIPFTLLGYDKDINLSNESALKNATKSSLEDNNIIFSISLKDTYNDKFGKKSWGKVLGVSREDISFETEIAEDYLIWNENSFVGVNPNFEDLSWKQQHPYSHVKRSGETLTMVLGDYNVGDELVVAPKEILNSRGISNAVILMPKKYFEEEDSGSVGLERIKNVFINSDQNNLLENFTFNEWAESLRGRSIATVGAKLKRYLSAGIEPFPLIQEDQNKLCSDLLDIDTNYLTGNTYYSYIDALSIGVYNFDVKNLTEANLGSQSAAENARDFIKRNSELSLAYVVLDI